MKRLKHLIRVNSRRLVKSLAPIESSVTQLELSLLRIVTHEANLIIDVGARTDIFFCSLKDDKCVAILIEANPIFYNVLKKKTRRYSNVLLKNVKISNENKEAEKLTYFVGSQSFDFNPRNGQNKTKLIELKTQTVESLMDEYGFTKIDFFKSDIEGYDFFALVGLGRFLNTTKYLQFELCTDLSWRGRVIEIQDYIELLGKNFDLFVMRDDKHSIWKDTDNSRFDLIPFDHDTQQAVKHFQEYGEGVNIFAVNKKVGSCALSELSIAPAE